MKNVLPVLLLLALLVSVAAGTAWAGLNAGAVAHLYWWSGTGTGLTNRDSNAATAIMLVTVKGVTNIAGADVQLILNSLDGLPVPECWLGTGTNGCADTAFTSTFSNTGPFGPYQKLFGTQVPLTPQNKAYFNYDANPCLTPHGVELFWLSEAIADTNGLTRTSTTEYWVWSLRFEQSGTSGTFGTGCPGDLGHSPRAVCINPNFRVPCDPGHQQGPSIQLGDKTTATDYAQFVIGNQWLTWEASAPGATLLCPDVTPAPKTTWGNLKRLYR